MARGPINAEALSTREAILVEAIACFGDHGYDGTSLNDIAAEVGIRRPSLLHHFPSKEALYGEVFERLLTDWFSRLEGAITAEVRGWEKVELVLNAGLPLLRRQPGLRPAHATRGHRRRVRTSASTSPPRCGRYFDAAAALLPRGRWRRGRSGSTMPTSSCITGYGALLSYFSDAAFVQGLLDVDPLDADVARASDSTTSRRSSEPRWCPDERAARDPIAYVAAPCPDRPAPCPRPRPRPCCGTYGVPVVDDREVQDADGAVAAARGARLPGGRSSCAATAIAHKTERGLVRLGLADAGAVARRPPRSCWPRRGPTTARSRCSWRRWSRGAGS